MICRHKLLTTIVQHCFTIADCQLRQWKQSLTDDDKNYLRNVTAIGHRFCCLMANGHLQESNSVALEVALRSPYLRTLECDVSQTKDGALIIAHDATHFAINSDTLIEDLTLADIDRVCHDQNYHYFTLDSFLQYYNTYVAQTLASNRVPIELNLEIKGKGIAKQTLTVLDTYPQLRTYIVISSFNKRNLEQVLKNGLYPVSVLVCQEPVDPIRAYEYIDTNFSFAIETFNTHPDKVFGINVASSILDNPELLQQLKDCDVPSVYAYSSVHNTPLENSVQNPKNVARWARLLDGKKFGVFIDRPDCLAC